MDCPTGQVWKPLGNTGFCGTPSDSTLFGNNTTSAIVSNNTTTSLPSGTNPSPIWKKIWTQDNIDKILDAGLNVLGGGRGGNATAPPQVIVEEKTNYTGWYVSGVLIILMVIYAATRKK